MKFIRITWSRTQFLPLWSALQEGGDISWRGPKHILQKVVCVWRTSCGLLLQLFPFLCHYALYEQEATFFFILSREMFAQFLFFYILFFNVDTTEHIKTKSIKKKKKKNQNYCFPTLLLLLYIGRWHTIFVDSSLCVIVGYLITLLLRCNSLFLF